MTVSKAKIAKSALKSVLRPNCPQASRGSVVKNFMGLEYRVDSHPVLT